MKFFLENGIFSKFFFLKYFSVDKLTYAKKNVTGYLISKNISKVKVYFEDPVNSVLTHKFIVQIVQVMFLIFVKKSIFRRKN